MNHAIWIGNHVIWMTHMNMIMNDSYEHDYEWLMWICATWSYECTTWFIAMCTVSRVSFMLHTAMNLCICIHTHSRGSGHMNDSYECATWFIAMCTMTWLLFISHMAMNLRIHIYIYTWYDSWAICVIAMCTMPRVTFTLYMWMSYEAHVNESCRTWRTSHVTMCVIAMCTMTRVMLRWRMSHMRHITHGNESCRTWVMLHMQMSYEAQVNTSCRTWRTSHVTMCIIAMCTKTRILRHMSHMRHIIRGKEACST